ncbi:MAG TPA: hypothetical protein VNF73_02605 [Candidatus Saccharimonadales bacterium]|nr:hypothetical protein [Candidatus Saccharimonadales bacterium]
MTTNDHHDHGRGARIEDAVLDIGGDIGALILYAPEEYDEREIEVSPIGDESNRVHTAIHERRAGGRTVHAGIYPALRAGTWRIWADRPGMVDRVTIVGGQVAEVDWRSRE